MDLVLPQDRKITGTVEQRCQEADLALIRLYGDHVPGPEIYFDQARRGELWRAARRSVGSDVLHGIVLKASALHHSAPGLQAIEVLILDCAGADGDEQAANRTAYADHAGTPIERAEPGRFPVVLGIAIRPGGSVDGNARPLLLAATVKEALRRFQCLQFAELVDAMWPEAAETASRPQPASSAPAAQAVEPFSVDEVPDSNPVPFREKYQNEVYKRLREYGFVIPVTIPSAINSDLTRPTEGTGGQQ